MDYKKINNILDKYWEGETSLQEEETLHEYFNSGEVADELKDVQPLFVYLQEEQATQLENPKFEEELLVQLEETIVRPIQPIQQNRRRRIISLVSRAAAIVLLVIGSVAVYQQTYSSSEDISVTAIQLEDLTEEERQAYEQTKAALAYLSSKLNKGTKIATDNLVKVSKKTEKSLK